MFRGPCRPRCRPLVACELRRRRAMPSRLLALAFVAVLSGCPGSIDDPTPFVEHEGSSCPDTYDVERDLFGGTCAQLACHSGGSIAAAGLDLAAPNIGERIMAHRSVDCGGRALVNPADLEGSYMMEKVDAIEPACGDQMPSGLEPLSPIERTCLMEYLQALAGSVDGGVPPALDAGTIEPPLAPIEIEAEAMTLEGYVVDTVHPDLIRLPDTVPMGIASATIDTAGTYQLRVYAIREPDGQPSLSVRVGGVEVASETFALGTADIEPIVLGPYEVDVAAGDRIELVGASNMGAWARVDRVELTP